MPLFAAFGALSFIRGLSAGMLKPSLAIAEMIASMSKPTVSVVLGGGHSIGIPIESLSSYRKSRECQGLEAILKALSSIPFMANEFSPTPTFIYSSSGDFLRRPLFSFSFSRYDSPLMLMTML